MATDILNSLGYRKIKDTYHSVLFVDNDKSGSDPSPTIYNGDGVIMPFTFSNNAINLSSNQLRCKGDLVCTNEALTNIQDTCYTTLLQTKNLQLLSDNNKASVYLEREPKGFVTNNVVRKLFSEQYTDAATRYNNISGHDNLKLDYIDCKHEFIDNNWQENGERELTFSVTNDIKSGQYVIIIGAIKVRVYQASWATFNIYINDYRIKQMNMGMSVTAGYSGGGFVPISFTYVIPPGSNLWNMKSDKQVLKFTPERRLNNDWIMVCGITDLLILHGTHI